MSENVFIDYDQLYLILNDKFKATHDEIRWWTKRNVFITSNHITAYISDIRCGFFNRYEESSARYHNFDSTLSFYRLKDVEKFKPDSSMRIVYIKDLAGQRNWQTYLRTETNYVSSFPALDRAASNGLLHFYDRSSDSFSLFKKGLTGDPSHDKLWIFTDEGEKYMSEPDNFFLLSDIINIERIFFKRPRNECIAEMGQDIKDYE